jgi:hypothetical protein
MPSAKGTQGKWAEDKVRDWLKKYKEARASFTFNRILDARSALGAMSNPQPGDFQWFMDTGLHAHHPSLEGGKFKLTRNGLIEVKSVQHTHLLRYGNFTEDQVGRMRLRAMAGSEPLVLVAFRPEGYAPYWRTAPLEFFEQRIRKGSWDMGDIDAYTHCDDILEMHLK